MPPVATVIERLCLVLLFSSLQICAQPQQTDLVPDATESEFLTNQMDFGGTTENLESEEKTIGLLEDSKATKPQGIQLHQLGNDPTITESIQNQSVETEDISHRYKIRQLQDELSNGLNASERENQQLKKDQANERIRMIGIGFFLEWFLTASVLIAACSIAGKSKVVGQAALIAGIVALSSTLLAVFVSEAPLHPARFMLGLCLLPPLLRSLTPLSNWTTVFAVSFVTRVTSIALLALALGGARALSNL